MMYVAKLFLSEFLKVVRNPTLLLRYKSKNVRCLAKLRLKGVSDQFVSFSDTKHGLKKREYQSYDAYCAHQKSKLAILTSGDKGAHDGTDLIAYDLKFRSILVERLRALNLSLQGKNCLCLAARLGTEVKAFYDHGAFALGIDLNPGPANQYVLEGDFHELVFPNASVDFVYCNSLDHAFDLYRMSEEVHRVLKNKGQVILEVPLGTSESTRNNTGEWEALEWTKASDLVDLFAGSRFTVVSSCEFEEPWPGKNFLLSKR